MPLDYILCAFAFSDTSFSRLLKSLRLFKMIRQTQNPPPSHAAPQDCHPIPIARLRVCCGCSCAAVDAQRAHAALTPPHPSAQPRRPTRLVKSYNSSHPARLVE
jgi:hypothetical protein